MHACVYSLPCVHDLCLCEVPPHAKPTFADFAKALEYISKNKEAAVLVLAAFTANKITELDQLEGMPAMGRVVATWCV